MSSRTEAVIEIGSTGIRALVANVSGEGGYEILDRAGKPVALGRDVFTTGLVSRESTRECIAVLRGFRELLRTYGVEPANARVIATSALREAENRDAFVDRVAMRTGFRVDIIEAIEESHYMYLAVQRALGGDAKYFARTNSIIIEVGGGSTELMLLRRGRIVAAHSLRLGTIRVDEQSRAAMGASGYLMRFLADNVRTACDGLEEDLSLAGVRSFIVIGNDARFAAKVAGTEAQARLQHHPAQRLPGARRQAQGILGRRHRLGIPDSVFRGGGADPRPRHHRAVPGAYRRRGARRAERQPPRRPPDIDVGRSGRRYRGGAAQADRRLGRQASAGASISTRTTRSTSPSTRCSCSTGSRNRTAWADASACCSRPPPTCTTSATSSARAATTGIPSTSSRTARFSACSATS